MLEHSHIIPKKHARSCKPFDLDRITVEDAMTPRAQIEALDLDVLEEDIVRHISTSYHTRLPVYRGELGNVVGILHPRGRSRCARASWPRRRLKSVLRPYFVPAGTSALTQLSTSRKRGSGLRSSSTSTASSRASLTLEDIIEEIIGEFSTTAPVKASGFARDEDGSALVEARPPPRAEPQLGSRCRSTGRRPSTASSSSTSRTYLRPASA